MMGGFGRQKDQRHWSVAKEENVQPHDTIY